jgi:four helix bundle protein
MDQTIKQKSRELAAAAAGLYRHLSAHKKETVLSGELLRSAGGVGADVVKADFAVGKNDRILKIYAALQGCAEAKYWLEVLNDNEYLTEFEFNATLKTCDEMGKLLISLVKSLRVEKA